MMLLKLLFKFLAGGGVSSIGAQINRAIEIRENAKTDQARLEAEENIAQLRAARDVEIKTLDARSKEVPDWATRIIRISLAVPAILILLKMTADYISTGKIDQVPDQLWWYVGVVIAWCFWAKPWGARK